MPESIISSFFTRSSSRGSLSSKDYKCTVQLLDDSESIHVEFKKHDTGQTLIDYVCNYLQILEKDYFGLRFIDTLKHRYWLDPTKPVLKQVKGSEPIIFRFRVRYYPADASVVKEELTRYQLFLQLRRDLLHGRLYAPQGDAAILGAYIIQSEQGDYDSVEIKEGYVSEYKMLLKQTAKVEERIEEVHKTLTGLTPALAEEQFLRKACKLDTYGFDPYSVKDMKVGQVYLGVTHLGVIVYQSNKKLHHISWDELDKVDYLGKDLYIYPKAEYIIDANQTMPHTNGNTDDPRRPESRASLPNYSSDFHNGSSKSKRTVVLRFNCASAQFCKHLWKHTLAQRAFFTENNHNSVKPQHSRRRIPVLSRGSTFRYTGRVLQEIKEDETPARDEPSFVRYHAERQPSRNDRAFPWNNKYATLPRTSSRDMSYSSVFATSLEDLDQIVTLTEDENEKLTWKLAKHPNLHHADSRISNASSTINQPCFKDMWRSLQRNKIKKRKQKMGSQSTKAENVDEFVYVKATATKPIEITAPPIASEEKLPQSEMSSQNNLCFDCSGKMSKKRLANRRNKLPESKSLQRPLMRQNSEKKVDFSLLNKMVDLSPSLDINSTDFLDTDKLSLYDNLDDSYSLNKEKKESNGGIETSKPRESMLFETLDALTPAHSPSQLSPDADVIAMNNANVSNEVFNNELQSSSPLSNSTPMKVQPVKISDINELKNRYNPLGDKVEKTTISVQLTSKQSSKQDENTTYTPILQQKQSGGLCTTVIGHILTGVLFTILLSAILVALMEIRDETFREYADYLPGTNTFRHSFYQPTRQFAINTYNKHVTNSKYW